MTLSGAVLAFLLSVPRFHEDAAEPPLQRVDRLSDLARGIAAASYRTTCTGPFASARDCRRIWSGDAVELAALQAVTAVGESALSARIQARGCHPHECDSGRSQGPMQVQALGPVSHELWARIGPGPDGAMAAAWACTLAYSVHAGSCSDRGRAGIVAGYASGSSCAWRRADARAYRWSRAEIKIRALLVQH